MTDGANQDEDHRRPQGAGGASVALADDDRDALLEVLGRAQQLGFLGPAPLEPQIDHALRFVDVVASVGIGSTDAPAAVEGLDLGSGGGLPGLVLALAWPASRWVLLDSMERRTTALREAVEELGVADRVVVDHRRAELAGHDPSRRRAMDLVTARSFGPPAVTAECGAPFLRPGGLLVVSDPPTGPGDRWPAAGVALFGLDVVAHMHGCTVLRAVTPVADDVPRRVGLPGKRPRF